MFVFEVLCKTCCFSFALTLRYSVCFVFRRLQRALLEYEFHHFDRDNKGYLTPYEFALSLLAFARVKDLGSYHKRAEQLKDEDGEKYVCFSTRDPQLFVCYPSAKISLEQYVRFSEMLKHVDDIDDAIVMFVSADGEISKGDLR